MTVRVARFLLVLAPVLAAAGSLSAQAPSADEGIPVTNETVIRNCVACHRMDEEGRMSRISYMRKTPEGWQASLRRMAVLYGVGDHPGSALSPGTAREVVRYLSNQHGIAPEELRAGLFEVERRLVEHRYTDDLTHRTCAACHSMGRVITQRRSREEWGLLAETHQGLYPWVDWQTFERGGRTEGRYAVDRVNAHLGATFPLRTPEWSDWSANHRPPRLGGSWALEGNEPGKGPVFGTLEIAPVSGTSDEFTTRATYVYARSGARVSRTGRVLVYTGYQWRGTSRESGGGEAGEASGARGDLREVMFVERDWRRIRGRWFTGPHDEFGLDVVLHRIDAGPLLTGVHPGAVRMGDGTLEVTIHGANLPSRLRPADVDLGPGTTVTAAEAVSPGAVRVRFRVASGAAVGSRDLFLAGAHLPDAIVLYDRVDELRVEPRTGMARVGGAAFPRQYQQFEAVGYHAGPDGEAGTGDDLRLGPMPATWSLEEYPVTYRDDDSAFVGTIDASGLFTPALDGPNPERSGDRNNIGDVWVVAIHVPPDGRGAVLRARAHLLVTAPLYMRWEPWRVVGEGLP